MFIEKKNKNKGKEQFRQGQGNKNLLDYLFSIINERWRRLLSKRQIVMKQYMLMLFGLCLRENRIEPEKKYFIEVFSVKIFYKS